MQSYRFLKLKIIMQRLVTIMTQFDLEAMSMFFLSATNTFWSLYCQGELVAHLIWFQFNGLLSYFRAYCIFMHEHILLRVGMQLVQLQISCIISCIANGLKKTANSTWLLWGKKFSRYFNFVYFEQFWNFVAF